MRLTSTKIPKISLPRWVRLGQPWGMDALQALLALALLFLPSPIVAGVVWLRARKIAPTLPPTDEEGGRRAYEAWARNQVTPDFPPWAELVEHSRETWRKVARAAYGLPLLLCLLFCASACGGPQRTAKHDLADSIDGNAADLAAFGRWDDERQARIVARCKAQPAGPEACARRLAGYRETRDQLRALLKKQILTLDAATKALGGSPEGSL